MCKSNHEIGCAHSLLSSARSKALPHTRRTSRCPVQNIIAFLHFQNQMDKIHKKNSVFASPVGLWHPSSASLSVHLGMLLAFELLLVVMDLLGAERESVCKLFRLQSKRSICNSLAVSGKLMSVPPALACIRSFSWPHQKDIQTHNLPTTFLIIFWELWMSKLHSHRNYTSFALCCCCLGYLHLRHL